jgi:hypothetical protein
MAVEDLMESEKRNEEIKRTTKNRERKKDG